MALVSRHRALAALRDALVDLYSDPRDARRLVDDAGLKRRAIDFSGSATNIWHSVLGEASLRGRVDELVGRALDEHPDNAGLRSAVDAWQVAAERVTPAAERPAALLVDHPTLLGLHAASVSAQLTASRDALLGGMPPAVRAALPHASTPAAQILSDLTTLNERGWSGPDGPPLQIWLANALSLTSARAEAQVLAQALDRVRASVAQPLSAASARTPTRETKRPRVDLVHLPVPAVSTVFGRSRDLLELEAALRDDATFVVGVIASGGAGKSALTNAFLNATAPGYGGAARVFGWSFYSQGSHATFTSSSVFLDEALTFFGRRGGAPRSDEDKAMALAEQLSKQRSLLVLDGVEPLQYPPAVQNGWFRDIGLRTLLMQVARDGLASGGLIVASSRQPLVELAQFASYQEVALGNLDPDAGKALLAHLGVRSAELPGARDEILAASKEYEGHALALVLLGRLLSREFRGDVLARFRIGAPDEPLAGASQASRILRYYEELWPAGRPERLLLLLLALFDRPVAKADLDVLLARASLAAPLRALPRRCVDAALTVLRGASLLVEDRSGRHDTHPLVRDHFNAVLLRTAEADFVDANRVLFEHFRSERVPERPSLEELEPLIRAVHHGCLAREYKAALDDVFYGRLLKQDEFYLRRELGAITTDLFLVSRFFDQGLAEPVREGLDESDRAWLVSEASLSLMALGRPEQAVDLVRRNLRAFEALGELDNVSVSYENLIDCLVVLGRLAEALAPARDAIGWARRVVDDYFREIIAETRLGTVLCYLGSTEDGVARFRAAESLFSTRRPDRRYLASLNGYRFTSILLDLVVTEADVEEALARADFGLEVAKLNDFVLDVGADGINRARALARLGRHREAVNAAHAAIDSLRRAQRIDYLAEGLLARGRILLSRWSAGPRAPEDVLRACADDLRESSEIITLGRMELHQCDALLLEAELLRAGGDRARSATRLVEARSLMARLGFRHRGAQAKRLAEAWHRAD
jgi:tetratricopeptide (TPR) repeat protein